MLADGVQEALISTSVRPPISGPLNLLWLGRLVPSKRPDIALRVLGRLVQMGVPVHLKVVGAGPMAAKLERIARDLDLGDAYESVGRVPWAETRALHQGADLLLFHSMRDSSCPSVLEAASQGMPTVGLRVQGFGSAIPETLAFGPTKLVNSRTLVEELADECAALYYDAQRYAAASTAALAFARTQTWNEKLNRILSTVGKPR
ncbi:glycosyltransferase family 4 protein [Cryobacterium sp. 10I5]|uniref:glycosyltransferase family 4 protein n=1 Tax=Cryobacterium sp. 10I5 TaxID=3048581 RepID=UPI003A598A05